MQWGEEGGQEVEGQASCRWHQGLVELEQQAWLWGCHDEMMMAVRVRVPWQVSGCTVVAEGSVEQWCYCWLLLLLLLVESMETCCESAQPLSCAWLECSWREEGCIWVARGAGVVVERGESGSEEC